MVELKRYRRLVVAGLGLIVVVAAGLRFLDLDRRTITHPEMNVAGIELPVDLVEPLSPHLTFREVFNFSIRGRSPPALVRNADVSLDESVRLGHSRAAIAVGLVRYCLHSPCFRLGHP